MGTAKRYSADALRSFIQAVLEKAGVPQEDAACTAANLLKAELWGVSTHGISRLPRYVMRLENGTINPRPNLTIQAKYPTMLLVDGDNGLGAAVMEHAIEAAMEKAEIYGICAVGVKNSNHFGMAGYYCALAAQRDMVALGYTNSLAAMAPWGGKEACLGTNPLAFGFPCPGRKPIIADMATSIAARGKILLAAKKGQAIPANWALDAEGKPTTDAKAAADGLVLPMAGPKGYALALSVDCLSGVLTGADFAGLAGSYKQGRKKAGIGHLFIVMKTDAFLAADEYAARMQSFCIEIKSAARAAGTEEIYLPGEREQLLEQRLLAEGVALPDAVEKELAALAEKYRTVLPDGII